MSYRTKTKDIAFGLGQEKELLNKLQKKFGEKLEISKKQYSPYDYRMKGIRVELKSRTNTKNQYPTTMIGKNKIKFANRFYGKNYFVFNFSDGIYYIRYDEDKFANYDVGTGGRADRGCIEQNQYIFIPVDDLKKL